MGNPTCHTPSNSIFDTASFDFISSCRICVVLFQKEELSSQRLYLFYVTGVRDHMHDKYEIPRAGEPHPSSPLSNIITCLYLLPSPDLMNQN